MVIRLFQKLFGIMFLCQGFVLAKDWHLHNDSEYFFSTKRVNYDRAVRECSRLNASLADFSSLDGSEDFVRKILGQKAPSEKTFYYISNVTQHSNKVATGFCLLTNSMQFWQGPCTEKNPFICKRTLGSAWSQWTQWSRCKRRCANQRARRSRVCVTYDAQARLICAPGNTKMTQWKICRVGNCAVSDLVDFILPCNATCGFNGSREELFHCPDGILDRGNCEIWKLVNCVGSCDINMKIQLVNDTNMSGVSQRNFGTTDADRQKTISPLVVGISSAVPGSILIILIALFLYRRKRNHRRQNKKQVENDPVDEVVQATAPPLPVRPKDEQQVAPELRENLYYELPPPLLKKSHEYVNMVGLESGRYLGVPPIDPTSPLYAEMKGFVKLRRGSDEDSEPYSTVAPDME